MNKLEELSSSNKENYKLYLKRMTESMKHSTKGLIPSLVKDSKNILDVGCGSGVMLAALEQEIPDAKLTGLDLNIDAINSLKKYDTKWELLHMDFMDLTDREYDAIIFSSILHEISSYNSDPKKRFTKEPIIDALKKCRELLVNQGITVIRDGILSSIDDRDNRLLVSFADKTDFIWLYRFQKEFEGFNNVDINTEIVKVRENKYMVSEGFLKEFLCKYTWGEQSFPREIRERFGILTKDEWLSIIKDTGFNIETVTESKEEYEKYLSSRINISYLDGTPYNYPNMSITIKGIKR